MSNRTSWNKGKSSWSKGLTAETDIRIKKAAEKRKGNMPPPWNTGLTKETDLRVLRHSESMRGKAYAKGVKHPLVFGKGLTKETDERIKRRTELLNATIHDSIKGKPFLESARRSGENAARSGQLFDAKKFTFVWHHGHFHRSKAELEFCEKKLSPVYGANLHTNVRKMGMEFDFVIGNEREDSNTWRKIVEYHVVKYWLGETSEDYRTNRLNKIRSLGISCPVEFVMI